jgi:hypothetical protein
VENSTHFNLLGLSLVLVLMGLCLTLMIMIVAGGFKLGRLKRRLELIVAHEQFPMVLARMNQRLTDLGFQAEGASGPYRQGKYTVGGSVAQTHARTTKVLEFTADQSNPRQVKLQLLLRFEEFIIGDSGETAYADAVLKFISNESDTMELVPNTSPMAFCSVVLAVWAWVVMIGLRVFRIEPFTPTMITLTLTSIFMSVIAIIIIALKPAELRGIWLAIVGMIVSMLALGASVIVGLL